MVSGSKGSARRGYAVQKPMGTEVMRWIVVNMRLEWVTDVAPRDLTPTEKRGTNPNLDDTRNPSRTAVSYRGFGKAGQNSLHWTGYLVASCLVGIVGTAKWVRRVRVRGCF